MASTVIQPDFCDPDTWRDWVKRNSAIKGVNIIIHTNETWMPLVLSQTGFFVSNGQVKKNRPDLWRDVEHGEEIVINNWAFIRVLHHDANGTALERATS